MALGSNLGNRRSRLLQALAAIRLRTPVHRISSFYRTEPVGHADQPDFYNAVAEIAWDGSPEELLAALQEIEREMGRVRRFENGPREIDLDILEFRGVVRSSPDPILPHPRMASRRFVLAPLAEIAPGWKHPVTGSTAREMLEALPGKPAVRRMRGKSA